MTRRKVNPIHDLHIPADRPGRVRLAYHIALTSSRYAESLIRGRVVHPKADSAALWRAYGASLRQNSPVAVVIDHTVSLAAEARRHIQGGRFGMAQLLYATYIEHRLNDIISNLGQWRKMKSNDITNMLRNTSLESKATWVLLALGVKPIPERHLRPIRRLVEARNRFVHYKWRPETSEPQRQHSADAENLKAAQQAIHYLNKRTTQLFFGGAKRRLVPQVKSFARFALACLERELERRTHEGRS